MQALERENYHVRFYLLNTPTCMHSAQFSYTGNGGMWLQDLIRCVDRTQVTYTHHSMAALPFTGYVVPFKVRHAQLGLLKVMSCHVLGKSNGAKL